jgi:membrane-associated phospholipid phosphatase
MFRTSELISVAYFVVLAASAFAARRRPFSLRTGAAACGVAAAVIAAAWLGGEDEEAWTAAFRDWLPLVLLLLSYWLPAALVSAPRVSLERRLLAFDARLLRLLPRPFCAPPRALRELLEVAYLAVYPMVPAAFGLLLAAGLGAHADRFWTTVLASEYACYILLPLLPTRPPRDVERTEAYGGRPTTIRRLNLFVLGRASNRWNTFPSGHVAGAAACALAVLPLLPATGGVLLALAALIAVGSVAGRYHYAADALAGLVVAGLAALLLAP